MKHPESPGLERFYVRRLPARHRVTAWLVAAVAAGTLSTAVQVLLWLLFTDQWPAILFRDARLAAAVVLGPSVLPPPASFDSAVMGAATVVHVALSLVYAGLVALLVEWRARAPVVAVVALGAAFGLALYFVNMHGFTLIYPWFAQARDWITVAAHLAFGAIAAVAYRWGIRGRLA